MSQEPHPEPQQDEERLSRTLFGSLREGLRGLASRLRPRPYQEGPQPEGPGGPIYGISTVLTLAGIACLVLGLVLLIFISDLRIYSYIILGIGGALILASMVISFRTVSRAVTGRRGRYSTNTTVMVVAFVGIVAVANFLAFENSTRMDVTATKQFSLAPRTVGLLKDLKEPIEAKAFFGPTGSPEEGAFRGQVDNLLHEFKARSEKFSYEFLDPDVDPLTAREYGITRYGTVVFEGMESKKRHQVSPSAALEQEFVTGLLIVTGQEQKYVYFLTGHGERDIQNFDRDTEGFGLAHDGITSENYAVSPLDLLITCDRRDLRCVEPVTGQERLKRDRQEKKVNMLVVAGPTKDLLEGEPQVLDDYLKNGGNVLFLLEPDTPQSFRDFLARWGIVVGDGHIVDKERSIPDNNEFLVLARDQYLNNLGITPDLFNTVLGLGGLTGRLETTYYPGAVSLGPAEKGVVFFPPRPGEDEKEGEDESRATIIGSALAVTSTESWLIKDPTRSEPQEGDPKGVFFPAVAFKAIAPLSEEPPSAPTGTKPASIVAFGDSDFATNKYFYTSSNSDFFLNSVNWLVGDIPLANIRPKPLAFRQLVTTRNEFNFMRFSGWLLLPALMALAGGFVWWRRR